MEQSLKAGTGSCADRGILREIIRPKRQRSLCFESTGLMQGTPYLRRRGAQSEACTRVLTTKLPMRHRDVDAVYSNNC